jgi:ribose transport system substrate-binding protein
MTRRWAVWITMLAGVALLGGAGPAPSLAQAKKRIAFANFNDEASFAAAVLRGFREAARARGDVEMLYYDNRQDAARSVENARTVAAQKVDLFIEYNGIQAANAQIARLMEEARIPVLAIQVPVPGAPLYAVNNPLSGTESGRALAETARARWGAAPPAALIIGLPEAGPLFIERSEAAKRAIKAVFPDITFDEHTSKNDTGVARQVTQDFLTRHPRGKVIIWVHVDGMALASLAAVRNAAREADVLIATTGGDRAMFPELRRAGSPVVGSFSFFPENWGAEVLDLVGRMLKGEQLPPLTHPGKQLLLTPANINEHYPR